MSFSAPISQYHEYQQSHSSSTHLDLRYGPSPSREEIDFLFHLCRTDDWNAVLAEVKRKPSIALTPMVMDNHISTTIIHQAITSKSDVGIRARVISTIMDKTPQAAAIRNGYGSLPLHVICQRNTKMDAQTKERLVFQMVPCFPEALMEQGGVGKRTPLHIIFTDYISPRMTRMMIDNGSQACFMKDKKGLLPAHVACMRHCSPEKLRMLLEVNPGALREPTNAGATLLSLAKKSATKAHPNYALIDELNRQLVGGSNNEPENTIEPAVYPETVAAPQANYGYQYHPFHVHQNPQYYQHYEPQHHQQQQLHRQHPQQHAQQQEQQYAFRSIHDTPASMNPGVGRVSSEDEDSWNRARLDSNDSNVSWSDCYYGEAQLQQTFVTPMATRARQKVTTSLPSSLQPSRKRKSKGNPDGVDLLLHFSRNSNGVGGSPPRRGRNGGFEMELQPSAVEHIPATGHEEKEDWGEKHVRSGRVAEV